MTNIIHVYHEHNHCFYCLFLFNGTEVQSFLLGCVGVVICKIVDVICIRQN